MSRRRWLALLLAAGAAGAVAVLAAPARAASTAAQIWAPFVLVTGLLLIGAAADADGLFAAAGGRLARLPGRPIPLFLAALALVAGVTAVLNLDTAVVFVTPVLLAAAASRGVDEAPFLYGSVAMCNSASLILPGSNLTNLLVLGHGRVSGATYALRMAPASAAAVLVTGAVLVMFFRRSLRSHALVPDVDGPRIVVGPGVVATVGAATLVLFTSGPALPVLVLGIAAVLVSRHLGRLGQRRLRAALNVRPLLLLFLVALALGTLARSWSGPTRLLAGKAPWESAALAAISSVLVNNLPAAALFSAHASADARALLVGLDVGPNLAVTGALSALLWLRIARTAGQRPSVRTYSLVGLAVAPLAMAAAIVALRLFSLGRL
jgi:arsenical pump membrane protein